MRYCYPTATRPHDGLVEPTIRERESVQLAPQIYIKEHCTGANVQQDFLHTYQSKCDKWHLYGVHKYTECNMQTICCDAAPARHSLPLSTPAHRQDSNMHINHPGLMPQNAPPRTQTSATICHTGQNNTLPHRATTSGCATQDASRHTGRIIYCHTGPTVKDTIQIHAIQIVVTGQLKSILIAKTSVLGTVPLNKTAPDLPGRKSPSIRGRLIWSTTNASKS